MPKPKQGEARKTFINRCMADAEAVSDYPDTDQRFAVCNSLWEGRKGGQMELETKSIALELKKTPDDDGVIEGYANVYEIVDQVDDIVAHGAFAKSLQSGRKVRMLWQHYSDMPIGVWDEIREDEKGLFVKGRISKDVQQGREAMALFKMGAIDSLSIGFRTRVSEKEGSSNSVRRILEGDLFEISVVTMPANDKAIASVKSIRTIREFERTLRDAGFSQNEAKAIAADGFKGLANHRDDVEDEADNKGFKALHDQLRQLQEKLTDV